MNSKPAALLLALSLPAFAGGQTPDFDNGVEIASIIKEARARAQAIAAAAAGSAKTEGSSLWVSLGREDIAALNDATFPLGAPVAQSSRASVFELPLDMLPLLSRFMHEKFNRCAGFLAHDTRQEAEQDLAAPVKSAAGPYTLDQESFVKPLMPSVKEAELRATIETLAAHNNRYYNSDTGVAAARWLAGRWQALAGKLPGAKVDLISHNDWKQPSVVLTIPGSSLPDEIVVLGGHLDSINGWGGEASRAPGADDNASGISVLTEAVRVLAQAGFRPKRTVQFMGYAAEEVGLRGSKDIAANYASAGKKVVGVIQYDMTNYKGSPEAIFLLTDNVNPDLTAFLGKLIDAYLGVKWSTTECGYGCSDHVSWTRSGYASSVAFESSFDAMNRALHTKNDTLGATGGTAEHSVPFAKLAVAFASELAKTTPPAGLHAQH